LDEADIIVFLDAVTSGAPAGTLYLAELPHSRLEPRALGSLSGHGFGLAEALALAEALGRRLPRMILVGIEIADASPGCELSPAVERAGGRLVKGFARLESALQAGEAFTRVRRFAPGEEFLREE
jgi:hydrogenase maturation protease